MSTLNSKPLHAKLKQCEPEIRYYIRALEKENAKLQNRVAQLEAKNVTANNRNMTLEKEIKKLHKTPPQNIEISFVSPKSTAQDEKNHITTGSTRTKTCRVSRGVIRTTEV